MGQQHQEPTTSAVSPTSRQTGIGDCRPCRLSQRQRLMCITWFCYEKKVLFSVWGAARLRCEEQSLVCEEQDGVVGKMSGSWMVKFAFLCVCLKGNGKDVSVVKSNCVPFRFLS